MGAPDFYSKHDGKIIADITQRLTQTIAELAQAEDAWLEVLSALETG